MSSFLHDLALAHQKHEGYFKGSLSYRQNNPGNLRGTGGVFRTFKTYAEGFAALQYDLKLKIFGTAPSVQRFMKGTRKMYEELTMQDYVSIYAPSADRNNPIAYCDALCEDLKQYRIQPSSPLFMLARLIRGEIEHIPDPPSPTLNPEQRLKSAENALQWADETRASMLRRLIDRLKRLL
jgi:hypothetical protein